MIINDPGVVAEVQAVFHRYETALLANDLQGLDAFFWTDSKVVRYGVAENLHGIHEIRAYRSKRSPVGLSRSLSHTIITTFGHASATASTLFEREAHAGFIGRQQQTWVRFETGWKIVAAHVSLIPQPAAS
ncbi:oxalurate catabolism protein HpxZ [Variovorax sp. J22P168]|uniref:oxalurate catabolism protein HpxZ n=1 Tax=Variovorax jilinensis TaxID=3053513 RepID=UPI0025785079|nr:oxalurate catabolism protein HpxZ [Variovorax sp. J22P168]MDM0015080.1 oxalurate catabolism protein HpxZ [Variovorax sp. J22P168]